MTRKAISKKTRFEVFKRDSFTCQYCGVKAPNIILEVDHIEPVSKGGQNDLLNLISSCKECNSGKSNRRLTDNSVLDKQRGQLEELQERKEQLEMMMRWQKELLVLENSTENELADFWKQLVPPYCLNENGRKTLKKLLSKYNLSEVIEAMKIAVTKYVELKEGVPTSDSVDNAWGYVGKICNVKRVDEKKPYFKDLLYIRGILRNRLSYCDESRALDLLEEAVEAGCDTESLKKHAKRSSSWSQWKNDIEELIEGLHQ